MPKITQLYAFVMADKDDNDEGVPCVLMGNDQLMPLMGPDAALLGLIRGIAQMAADRHSKPLKLLRSTGLEVVEVLQPRRDPSSE